MTNRLSREVSIALGVIALLALAFVGYFLLIGPQRSEASRLDREIEETRQQIVARRAASRPAPSTIPIRPEDLRQVTRAMPDRLPIAGVVLELNRIAGVAGLGFESIAPQVPVPLAGYQAVPLDVTVQGRFFDVNEFIARVRNRASVSGRRVADGRLFAIESVDLSEGENGLPQVRANLRINAFTFAGGAPAGAAGTAAGGTTTTTTTEGTP